MVKIQGFQGNAYEIEFAICIMKHSRMLEMMVINPFSKIYWGGGDWMDDMVVEAVHHHNRRLDPSWEENCRAFVEEKLKDGKTNAQVIIL
ncbi:hypothetical protein ACFX2I_023601 [Malus domestica]